MELVYLYIDEYHNFKEVEFNFSQDLKIALEKKEKILSVKKMGMGLPKEFWGENICNLSMIVGNNGAGKSSMMQYLILMCKEMIEGRQSIDSPENGIVVFRENGVLYYYISGIWCEDFSACAVDCESIKGLEAVRIINSVEGKEKLERTKFIFMTNVLSLQDFRRSWRKNYGRDDFLYDCSLSSLVWSDVRNDVNNDVRVRKEEKNGRAGDLEHFFAYEAYKQIKFVFDRNQFQILEELKEQKYPVPVPERLYIDIQLYDLEQTIFYHQSEKVSYMQIPRWTLDTRIEKKNLEKMFCVFEKESPSGYEREKRYGNAFLKYVLSKNTMWCGVLSVIREMPEEALKEIYCRFRRWEEEEIAEPFVTCLKEFREWTDDIMGGLQQGMGNESQESDRYWNQYLDFLKLIREEDLIEHFRIESTFDEEAVENGMIDPECNSLRVSIDTSDSKWFMSFLEKYRYVCNPDYFLDFSWGLSSGENNLLSMFASLYYIFDADYTNPQCGEYKIFNNWISEGKTKRKKCDSIILMIDEADLTYHPEWQREFVSLLTAFLQKIYAPKVCGSIQIILSTHSPILLSDIPQQNVIYLKLEEGQCYTRIDDNAKHQGTFGQNIHLLMKDGFFLQRGTMGCFAEKKILNVFHELKEAETLVDEILEKKTSYVSSNEFLLDDVSRKLEMEWKPFAELIAEPLIQRKLLMKIEKVEGKIFGYKQQGQGRDGLNYKQREVIRKMSDEELLYQLQMLLEEREKRGDGV